MTASRKYGIGGALVAVLVAGSALWPDSVSVVTVQVTRQTVREFIEEEGKTRLSSSYVVDMPVTGTLRRIELEEGDCVSRGQIVATIDPFEFEQAIARTEAEIRRVRAQIEGVDTAKPKPQDLDAARARAVQMRDAEAIASKELEIARINLGKAKTDYDRYVKLLEQKAVSQSAYDEADRKYQGLVQEVQRLELATRAASAARASADLEYESLAASVDDNEYMRGMYQATIEGLEASLAELKDNWAKTRIESPIDGVVLEKPVDSERVLTTGTIILVLGRPEDIEVEVDVLSEDVVRVRPGARVEIDGAAVGRRVHAGKVKRIFPSGFKKISALGIEQQRVKVIVVFDDTPLELRPGTSVDVRIIVAEKENALAVPDAAVFRESGEWYAMRVTNGRAERVPVTLGLRNTDWAEVQGGLSDGDEVIVDAPPSLMPGTRVLRTGPERLAR